MTRRQQLTEPQLAALFDPPTDQRELARHYTLSEPDIAAIRRCRGDHSRLGYALMLCYLRYPGRPLNAGERPQAALVAFIAGQIDVLPNVIGDYLASEQNRRRHAIGLQEQLRLRPFGSHCAADLTAWLLPHAIENDRLVHLAELVMEECRQRRIVVPRPRRLERLCVDVRHAARREVQRRLTGGLSVEQRKQLDALLSRRDATNQSWLAWLRQAPEAAKPGAMLGLIERLKQVRSIGLNPAHAHRVHQARLAQIVRDAGRATVWHISEYERQRRHATLAATVLDLSASLTDQAIGLFDQLIGTMFRKTEGRHARAFQVDGRAINEKVRLYARVGAALIAARDGERDAFDAIAAVISWDRFRTTVAEAEALARPESFDTHQKLGEHYTGIRRWSATFLAAFEFEGVPTAASLLRAIEALREADRLGKSMLPKSAPTGFVRQRWASLVLPNGEIDRRHYELCALSELRDRLRAGDIWVTGSRQYRSFEERLISKETMQELQLSDKPLASIEMDFDRFIEERSALLDKRLTSVNALATAGSLADVTINKGVLKITPIEKSTPPDAAAMAARLYATLPRIRITDLLAEVAGWTRFVDCFTHQRTGETAKDSRILMAALLAEGLNLGLTRMAEACSVTSLGHLA